MIWAPDDRPVFILGQGPSLYDLEKNIDRLIDLPVYWAGFNRFDITQKILLNNGKHYNFIYFGLDSIRFGETRDHIINFLGMGGERIAIYNALKGAYLFSCLRDNLENVEFLNKRKFDNAVMSSENIDNGTYMHFIVALYKYGFRRFCLFGLDGAEKFGDIESYYGETKMAGDNLAFDTIKINDQGWSLFRNYFKKEDVEIFNGNLNSKVNLFKKKSYEEIKEIYG